jgi:hypothetical protein
MFLNNFLKILPLLGNELPWCSQKHIQSKFQIYSHVRKISTNKSPSHNLSSNICWIPAAPRHCSKTLSHHSRTSEGLTLITSFLGRENKSCIGREKRTKDHTWKEDEKVITFGSATNFLGCDKGYIKNDYAVKIVQWHSHILWHNSTRLSYLKVRVVIK